MEQETPQWPDYTPNISSKKKDLQAKGSGVSFYTTEINRKKPTKIIEYPLVKFLKRRCGVHSLFVLKQKKSRRWNVIRAIFVELHAQEPEYDSDVAHNIVGEAIFGDCSKKERVQILTDVGVLCTVGPSVLEESTEKVIKMNPSLVHGA